MSEESDVDLSLKRERKNVKDKGGKIPKENWGLRARLSL